MTDCWDIVEGPSKEEFFGVYDVETGMGWMREGSWPTILSSCHSRKA